MHVPAISERAALIKSVLAHTQCNVTDVTVNECASRARGSVAVDLACAVDAAALESLADYAGSCHCDMSDCRAEKEAGSQGPQLHDEHLQKAMRRMAPSTTGEKVSADSGEVSWDDIGGQGAAKQALKEAMQLTRNAADDRAAVSGNMPHPGGLLLHGPPGCSKTMLARAAASDAGMTMLSVKGPELYSRYVGESEKAVKSLFRRARAAAPAIVLLDELDGLAPPRSAELKGEEASSRVLAQLLTELDSGLAERGVFTLAATNRPDMVDGALLRPGRFSRHIHVQPPVSIEERHEILRAHTRGMRFKSEEERNTALAWVASEAPSFTGADLARVCSEAGLNAIARSGESADSVAKEDFESALSLVRRERFRSHER
jgi:AAA family ATPase